MKKIVIIGAGISGLTAGIYAQKAGFETEIYEKHTVPGGQCTGWKRKDFYIDNCISWMTGASERYAVYPMWKEIGFLTEDVKVKQHEAFYTSELDGRQVSLYRDLEKAQNEMLKLSPQDKKIIKAFFKAVKQSENLQVPVKAPMDMMNLFDFTKLGLSMIGIVPVMLKYSKMTLGQLSKKFKDPLLQKMILDYLPESYSAHVLFCAYGAIASGGGGVPYGGSLNAALRIAKKYESLGGKIHLKSNVKEVVISGGKTQGIKLEDGTMINADYVICSTDIDHAFHNLMSEELMPKALRRAYEDNISNPLGSSFQVAYVFDGETTEVNKRFFFDCEGFSLAQRKITRMNLKNYSFDPEASPKGKSLFQVKILQNEDEYLYWENLYKTDKKRYEAEEAKASEDIMKAIEKRFPFTKGKLTTLDVWTPYTYTRFCNAYRGVYMSFITTPKSKGIFQVPGVVKGVSNLFLAGQWLGVPGGIPIAMTTGKFAVQRILKSEGKSIKLEP
jgi:phytoene dehydrogenase-like protein